MKSVLPNDLEAKRQLMIRVNDKQVYLTVCVAFAFIALSFFLMRRCHDAASLKHMARIQLAVAFVFLVPAGIYNKHLINQQNAEECRRIGFTCPHCRKPLFRPRGHIHITGRCPSCGERLTDFLVGPDKSELI